MKRKWLFLTILIIFALLVMTSVVYAEVTYDLHWWTVDAGGGTSHSPQYSLSGTIGQADAWLSTGGKYILSGGFWGGASPQVKQLFLPVMTK